MPGVADQDDPGMGPEVEELRARVRELESQHEALRKKEAILHATLNVCDDGVLAVNECGQVVFANRQFLKMWRIPPDLVEAADDNEMLNFVLDQLKEPDAFLSRVRELYSSLRTSTDKLHFIDGRVFLRTSHPLVVDDALCGRVWTFRDETPAGALRSRAHA
jgi:PAS domain-containing protein